MCFIKICGPNFQQSYYNSGFHFVVFIFIDAVSQILFLLDSTHSMIVYDGAVKEIYVHFKIVFSRTRYVTLRV